MLPKIFERSDLPLSEEELQARRQKRRRLGIIIAAVLIVIAIGCFSARPVLNAVRAWQARRHAEKAYAFIEQQKWGEARAEAVAAYQLRSTEPEALRAVARLLSRAGQADALPFWKELRSRQSLTVTDLRDEASVALKAHELDLAESALKTLLSRPDKGSGDLLLAAQLSMQKQDTDRATAHIRTILNDTKASDRDRFQATLLLASILRTRDAKDQREVLDRLVQLAQGANDVGLDALVALAQSFLGLKEGWPNPGGMSGEQIAQALETHPLAKAQHKLLAVDVKIRLHPEQRGEIVQTAITQLKNGDNADLIALAAWLNSHNEHQLELDTVPRQRAMQTRELFFQHVDALGALGRWDEIRRLIESEQFPLDPVMEHMYLARCFAQQNQSAGAENNWKRALQAAAGDTGKLVTLADYAEKNGALDVAMSAFEAAVEASPKTRVAQQGRLRVAYALRDTKKIHAILTDLLKIWPNDTAVQNDEAYARLLLLPSTSQESLDPSKVASELRAIELLAQKLVEREPASLPHRTVLALARLKQNRPYDALSVYRGIAVPKNTLTTSTISVHAAVLAATNEKEAAKSEIDTVPVDKLLPEERALIDGD